jgi:peptidyl-prolyl cis-trans isomerase A (cyclophilin A)
LTGVTELDRAQEKEADILGIRVACQAGFDPEGMLIVMRALLAQNPTATSFMQNHPSGVERLHYLQGEVQKCKAIQTPNTAEPTRPSLLSPETVNEIAPSTFLVRFRTTTGEFTVRVERSWAPFGADRFYNLVRADFFKDCSFFRVLPNFIAQFGISAQPDVSRLWADAKIVDDPVIHSNQRGTVVFAKAGPNTRTTQVFINFRDNRALDAQGFAPFGEIVSGLEVAESVYSSDGERPNQALLSSQGKPYLDRNFPNLDRILEALILTEGREGRPR